VSSLPVQQSEQQTRGSGRAWPYLFLLRSPGSRGIQLDRQQQNRTSAEQAPILLGRDDDGQSGQQARLEPRSRLHRERGDRRDAAYVPLSTSSVREQSRNESIEKTQARPSNVVLGSRRRTGTSEAETQQTPQGPSQHEAKQPAGRQTDAGTAADTKDKPTSEKNNTETLDRDEPADKAATAAVAGANGRTVKQVDGADTSQVLMNTAQSFIVIHF